MRCRAGRRLPSSGIRNEWGLGRSGRSRSLTWPVEPGGRGPGRGGTGPGCRRGRRRGSRPGPGPGPGSAGAPRWAGSPRAAPPPGGCSSRFSASDAWASGTARPASSICRDAAIRAFSARTTSEATRSWTFISSRFAVPLLGGPLLGDGPVGEAQVLDLPVEVHVGVAPAVEVAEEAVRRRRRTRRPSSGRRGSG